MQILKKVRTLFEVFLLQQVDLKFERDKFNQRKFHPALKSFSNWPKIGFYRRNSEFFFIQPVENKLCFCLRQLQLGNLGQKKAPFGFRNQTDDITI